MSGLFSLILMLAHILHPSPTQAHQIPRCTIPQEDCLFPAADSEVYPEQCPPVPLTTCIPRTPPREAAAVGLVPGSRRSLPFLRVRYFSGAVVPLPGHVPPRSTVPGIFPAFATTAYLSSSEQSLCPVPCRPPPRLPSCLTAPDIACHVCVTTADCGQGCAVAVAHCLPHSFHNTTLLSRTAIVCLITCRAFCLHSTSVCGGLGLNPDFTSLILNSQTIHMRNTTTALPYASSRAFVHALYASQPSPSTLPQVILLCLRLASSLKTWLFAGSHFGAQVLCALTDGGHTSPLPLQPQVPLDAQLSITNFSLLFTMREECEDQNGNAVPEASSIGLIVNYNNGLYLDFTSQILQPQILQPQGAVKPSQILDLTYNNQFNNSNNGSNDHAISHHQHNNSFGLDCINGISHYQLINKLHKSQLNRTSL
jgi:hypothetical protein